MAIVLSTATCVTAPELPAAPVLPADPLLPAVPVLCAEPPAPDPVVVFPGPVDVVVVPVESLEEPPDPDPVPDPTLRPVLPELPFPLPGRLSTGSPAEQETAKSPSVKNTNFGPSKSR